MEEYSYTLDGELPKGYPEPINFAWFPTNETCEEHGLPSWEGYLSLRDAVDRNPQTLADDDSTLGWQICAVEGIEDCVIHV